MRMRRSEAGFAYIAAVVFLVVLAGLAAAVLRLGATQQATVGGALQGMRAGQAARGGLEWAFYQLRTGSMTVCGGIDNGGKGTTLDAFADGHGLRVTLHCTAHEYREGEFMAADGTVKPQAKRIFELAAVACNGAAGACPDAGSVAGADYVERRRSASICVTDTGGGCY